MRRTPKQLEFWDMFDQIVDDRRKKDQREQTIRDQVRSIMDEKDPNEEIRRTY